ncbi:MAG: hypothetical protein RR320_08220, partial [Oscillospiraceae bacterium]
MSSELCPDCHGQRLKPVSLAVTVNGVNISELTAKSVTDALDLLRRLTLTEREHLIADQILKEICERLGFLKSVG